MEGGLRAGRGKKARACLEAAFKLAFGGRLAYTTTMSSELPLHRLQQVMQPLNPPSNLLPDEGDPVGHER